MKKILRLIIVLALIVGAAFLGFSRDWQTPAIKLAEATYINQAVLAMVSDNRGLGEVCYYLDGKADGKSCVNADGVISYKLTVDLSALADGEHEVCVEATDANLYFPNRVSQCRSYVLDKVPPRAVLKSATRYMRRGGRCGSVCLDAGARRQHPFKRR